MNWIFMCSAMEFSDFLYNLTTDKSAWLVLWYIAWTLTKFSLLLHRAFWRFNEYYTPTNSL